MDDFSLYKKAKRIVNKQEPYEINDILYDTFGDKQEGLLLDSISNLKNLREIEVVSLDSQQCTRAGSGFFALNCGKGVRMAIVDVDEIDGEFLEESHIVGLFLGDRVKVIGDNHLWQQLRYIYVKEANPNFCAENNVLYTKDKSKLIAYASNRPEEEFKVEYKTKEIEFGAFFSAKYLKKLYLPKDIKLCKDSLPYNKSVEIIFY